MSSVGETALPLVLLGVLYGYAADPFTGDDQLHDLRRAVADLEPHRVPQALLVGKVHGPARVPMSQNALMDGVERSLRRHPLDHRSLGRVRQARVSQRKSVVAKLPAGGELRLEFDDRERHALVLRKGSA